MLHMRLFQGVISPWLRCARPPKARRDWFVRPLSSKSETLSIALVGRPNTGLQFKVTDTGGFDDRGAVSADIQAEVELAVKTCDLVLFMIDTKAGVTALDKQFAKWLRMRVGSQTSEANAAKVILVANKAEGGYMADSTLNI
eukprot:gene46004-56305_t